MKILIISNMYPSREKSFAGIFVKNQYEAIRDIMVNDEIDIFYMRRRFTSKLGSALKYISAVFGFVKFLFKRYDIIHLHYLYPLIYLANFYKILYPNTKLVVTYHGSDVTKKINKKNIKSVRKLLKKVDYHIPVGNALAKILETKTKTKADKILPVGVNDKVFYFENVDKVYDFIYVGSFIHRKGVDLILDIIPELEGSITICFVGQGDYIDLVRELGIKYKNIEIYEDLKQDEIQKLIIRSKFLLLPTRNEGFPTSTIESMYCGVPVLVSDIPQTKEQVEEGENGFIIPVDDRGALLNKVRELSKIDEFQYKKMVQKTLTYYREISLSNVCKELSIIYQQLIKNV